MTDILNNRIAIFDDEQDILSICILILEDQGWQVSTFKNCDHIVEKMNRLIPAAILMDNKIPDIGGVEASRLLKSDDVLQKIPLIYFSASNDIKMLSQQASAQAFLAKPFDLGDLEKIILSVIEKN